MNSVPPPGLESTSDRSSNADSLPPPSSVRFGLPTPAVKPPPLPPRKAGSSGSHRVLPRPQSVSQPPQDGKPQPWQMPEPYNLVRPLAFGGLTYEAQNSTTGRRLFVRLYPEIHELSQLVERFERPSQLACSHTVRIVDVGIAALPVPLGYVVSEFIEGPSLQAVLEERGVLAPHVGLRLIAQVLASLEEAHRQGLSHGKITTESVLLGRGTLGEPVAKLYGCDAVSASKGASSMEAVARDIQAVALLLCCTVFGKALSAVDSVENRRELAQVTAGSAGLEQILSSAFGWEAFSYQSATQFGSALAGLPAMSTTTGKRRSVSVLDSASIGATDTVRDLFPSRLRLSASRPLTIWVLGDDPVFSSEMSAFALEELASVCEVRHLGAIDQAAAGEQLAKGELLLPWVVLFGETHVRRNEPLLALLASSRELSRLLVCAGPDMELLRRAARFCGVDGCVTLAQSASSLSQLVVRLADRTREKSSTYDSLRRDIRGALDEVGELSRAAAAGDVPEVPSSRSWSARGWRLAEVPAPDGTESREAMY